MKRNFTHKTPNTTHMTSSKEERRHLERSRWARLLTTNEKIISLLNARIAALEVEYLGLQATLGSLLVALQQDMCVDGEEVVTKPENSERRRPKRIRKHRSTVTAPCPTNCKQDSFRVLSNRIVSGTLIPSTNPDVVQRWQWEVVLPPPTHGGGRRCEMHWHRDRHLDTVLQRFVELDIDIQSNRVSRERGFDPWISITRRFCDYLATKKKTSSQQWVFQGCCVPISVLDVFLHWFNNATTERNISFTPKEDQRIISMVLCLQTGRYKPPTSWAHVAQSLPTKRSAFQCVQRFQRLLHPSFLSPMHHLKLRTEELEYLRKRLGVRFFQPGVLCLMLNNNRVDFCITPRVARDFVDNCRSSNLQSQHVALRFESSKVASHHILGPKICIPSTIDLALHVVCVLTISAICCSSCKHVASCAQDTLLHLMCTSRCTSLWEPSRGFLPAYLRSVLRTVCQAFQNSSSIHSGALGRWCTQLYLSQEELQKIVVDLAMGCTVPGEKWKRVAMMLGDPNMAWTCREIFKEYKMKAVRVTLESHTYPRNRVLQY